MSLLDRLTRRGGRRGLSGAAPAESDALRGLRHRRDLLAAQVAELYSDLGGLTYEMAIRDHFRLDVLVRRAAALQQLDAELAEAERLLRTEETGAVGSCRHCGAPRSRGAAYCWQCGQPQLEQAQVSREQPTIALPAP